MFNLDTDTVLLKFKTTGQRAVFVAFFVTKKISKQCFHPHLKSNCLLFLYAYSFNKEKIGTNFVVLFSIVK